MKQRVGATAAIVVLFAVFAIDIRHTSRLHAQDAANPAFEVASVKRNTSNDGRVMLGFQPGGRFNATGVTLKMLIGMAYGAGQPLAPFQTVGGPDWLDRDRFDIVAKAEGDVAPGPNGPIPLMVRALLVERFKLVVHTESREMPVYALVKAKADGSLGPQLKPAAVDCSAMRGVRGGPPPAPPAPGERPPCAMRIAPGNLQGGGMNMAQLSSALMRMPAVNRMVLDRTGLTGGYDFDLTWTPDQMPQLLAGGPPPGAPPFPPIDPNGPSLFAAVQEQLGLKLESTKGPVDIVVVDAAEQPTED
jgi:bla regulator protein blaR1